MTTLSTDVPTIDPHQAIEELLPWYANGALNPAERIAVEQHLERCSACRLELAQCRVLVTQFHDRAEAAWQPPAGHFDRLLADIDRLPPPVSANPPPPLRQRLLGWLRITPSPVRWTLALESLAVAALLLIVAMPLQRTLPDYETLSSDAEPTVAGTRLRTVFAESATIGEIQQLLHSIDAAIVAGPTTLGVYTLVVPGGDRPAEARDRAVAILRAHAQQVRLVEPLEPH